MNSKAVWGVVVAISIALLASYIATTSTLEGSLFDVEEPSEVASTEEVEAIKALAEKDPSTEIPTETGKKTPADYTIQDLKAEKTESGYLLSGRLQNLGTTVTALPAFSLDLNGTVISELSGMVQFSFVAKDGMNFTATLAVDSEYLNTEGSNVLKATADTENKVEEANEENNSVEITF